MNLVQQAGHDRRIYECGKLIGFVQGLIGGIFVVLAAAALVFHVAHAHICF